MSDSFDDVIERQVKLLKKIQWQKLARMREIGEGRNSALGDGNARFQYPECSKCDTWPHYEVCGLMSWGCQYAPCPWVELWRWYNE